MSSNEHSSRGEPESPATCRRCDLWKHATQAVTGEGSKKALIMLVGEQPGDEEDLRAEGERARELRNMLVQDLRRAGKLAK
jgi:uracil-DNA glycosylase family 4